MKNNGKSSLNTKIDIWVKIMKNRTTEQNLKTNFDLQECLKAWNIRSKILFWPFLLSQNLFSNPSSLDIYWLNTDLLVSNIHF